MYVPRSKEEEDAPSVPSVNPRLEQTTATATATVAAAAHDLAKDDAVVATRPRSVTRTNSLPALSEAEIAAANAAVKKAEPTTTAGAGVAAPSASASHRVVPALPTGQSMMALKGPASARGPAAVGLGLTRRATPVLEFSQDAFNIVWHQSWSRVLRECLTLYGFDKLAREFIADMVPGKMRKSSENGRLFPEIMRECERATSLERARFAAEVPAVRRAILGVLFRTLGMLSAHSREIITQADAKADSWAQKGFQPDPANLREIHRVCAEFIAYQAEYAKIVRAQARARGWLARKHVAAMRKDYSPARNSVFVQIFRAERALCAKLDVLVKRFVVPLQDVASRAPIISEEEIALAFGETRQLYILHTAIQSKLEKIRRMWPCLDGVGAIFQELRTHFRVYSSFAINTEVRQATLAALERDNAAFAGFLQAAIRGCPADVAVSCDSRSGAAFASQLLMAPIAHVSSYAKHLKDLCEFTPDDSPDLRALRDSLLLVSEINRGIQAALRAAGSRAATIASMARFGGFSAAVKVMQDKPERTQLFECDLCIVAKKKNRGRRMVVFTDKIVFASAKEKRSSQLTIEEIVFIPEMTVREPDPKSADAKLCCEISTPGDGGTPLVLKLPSEMEKVRVMHELEQARKGPQRSTKVFGIPLEEAATGPRGAPLFLERTCEFVLNHLDTPGIFRLSAQETAEKLRKEVDATPNFSYKSNHDPVAAAACLKVFLRELPEPLFTTVLYPRFIAINTEVIDDEEQFSAEVVPLMIVMPEAHRKALRVMLEFLFEVAQASDVHKLDEHTLAVILGSSLLRQSGDSDNILDVPTINAVLMGMIINAPRILQLTE